jgi:DNA-binding transcriptional LysR family regulator
MVDWTKRIGRRIKLHDLHILLTVVQCGSMAKAARQLAVSNPVVSKAIADLEHAMGVRLLVRSREGVEATVYGRALLDRSTIVFDELRQAVKHIESLADPTAGEVRIGTSIVIASGFAAATIDRLSRRHPRIEVFLIAGEGPAMYRELEERKVDLLISRRLVPIVEERMHAEILYEEPHVVVAGVGNALANRRKITLADVIDEPWTLPAPNSGYGSLFTDAFRHAGLDLPPTKVVTFTNLARIALVANGRFLTIVPESVLRFAFGEPAIKALPIDLPTTRRPIAIVTMKNRTLNPTAQLFVECAREVAGPLAKRKLERHVR